MNRLLLLSPLAALVFACGHDTSDEPPGGACSRGTLEDDLDLGELAGPGVGAHGELLPPPGGGFVVSATYVAVRDDANHRFDQLVFPIFAQLQQQPGLLAIQSGNSRECRSGRIFAVWRDEDAMFAFVTGPAHSDAMNAVAEVSRGGSAAIHWNATSLEQATWTYAAEMLGAHQTPLY